MNNAAFATDGDRPPPFIILSAERPEWNRGENFERTQSLCALLDSIGLNYYPVTGSYKGRQENSFLVHVHLDSYGAMHVLRIARHFSQESVLHVNKEGLAVLLVPERGGVPGTVTPIGRWIPISPEEALKRDGWTQDGADHYYATV